MFGKCSSLSSLPDISKWSTNNVINMKNMLYACSSLSSLPDISKWSINMYEMFKECLNIIISKKLEAIIK